MDTQLNIDKYEACLTDSICEDGTY